MTNKIIVGVTGGLASGKTVVADMFVEKGASKIDADVIGHRILEEDKEIMKKLVEVFGEKIIKNGKIDRNELRKEVFFDKTKLKQLNDLMHPRIIKAIRSEIDRFKKGVLVVDAPLLIEAGLHKSMDVIVVVTASYPKVKERAAARGLSEEEVQRIWDNQLSVSEKLRYADHVIDNNGDIDKTKEGVEKAWKRIQGLQGRQGR